MLTGHRQKRGVSALIALLVTLIGTAVKPSPTVAEPLDRPTHSGKGIIFSLIACFFVVKCVLHQILFQKGNNSALQRLSY